MGAQNFLGPDIVLEGDIHTSGNLIFDGTLKGSITGENSLTIGSSARIEGRLTAQSLTIHGRVTGDVMAIDLAELKGGSALHGDVVARRLRMEEGVVFIGNAKVSPK
ncbi:MAG TPA: polymer-forming cytoskeletal protein [Chthoniobacterales bacterium]